VIITSTRKYDSPFICIVHVHDSDFVQVFSNAYDHDSDYSWYK